MNSDALRLYEHKDFYPFLVKLQQVRTYEDAPTKFWQIFLQLLIDICPTEAAQIVFHTGDDDAEWQIITELPEKTKNLDANQALTDTLSDITPSTLPELSIFGKQKAIVGVLRLKTSLSKQICCALFYLGDKSRAEVQTALNSLLTFSDIPYIYQFHKSATDAVVKQDHFASIIDLSTMINNQDRFLAACMTLCNELAMRFQCDRVSIGWIENGYIKLKTMSHIDDFDKKMNAVRTLELAMEEAYDQDTEIVLPPDENDKTVLTNHQTFSRTFDVKYLASLPLRLQSEPIAIVTLEKKTEPFSEATMQVIHLICTQITRRLVDLYSRDRWFGARFNSWLRKKLSAILGYEHTTVKLGAIILGLALAFICFIPLPYRVESKVILRSHDIAYITSPFEGYIENAFVRAGDEVKSNAALLRLDQAELLLEEAKIDAEINRYQRETEKARAGNKLADMRISQTLYDQATIRMKFITYRKSMSIVRAPFNGIVIEGDQVERIGSSVKQGEVLYKIGRSDQLYLEMEVDETDIDDIQKSLDGEMALISKPYEIHKIQVTRIDPSAVTKKDGNIYVVQASLLKSTPTWWRPGMTGVGKINSGKKTLLWLMTHRMVDFLKLKLWW